MKPHTVITRVTIAIALTATAIAQDDNKPKGTKSVNKSAESSSVVEPGAMETDSKDFLVALAKIDAAQLELQNGLPAAFKALWSHSDDVTLSGGFGGTIEKGWEQISRRLDWVGAQFSNGTNTIERIVAKANGGLAYVVQIEHIRFHVPRQEKESTRDYRVTMLFRHESDGWRIIHRQADSQMAKQAPH
jgi:ketosteroid isomerase-like protein